MGLSDNNFLNIPEAERNAPIYHVFQKWDWLKECFEQQLLRLRKPQCWSNPKTGGDPFENFYLKPKGRLETGESVAFSMKDQLYGLCWSLHRESDAMWKLYSPDGDGSAAKTTVRRLLQALHKSQGQYRDLSCFIGRVEYLPQTELLKLIEDQVAMVYMVTSSPNGEQIPKLLLLKRTEFEHEREIRLIYFDADKRFTTAGDELSFRINPLNLFDEVIFDLRTDDTRCDERKEWLRRFGYNGPAEKSKLYTLPDGLLGDKRQ